MTVMSLGLPLHRQYTFPATTMDVLAPFAALSVYIIVNNRIEQNFRSNVPYTMVKVHQYTCFHKTYSRLMF